MPGRRLGRGRPRPPGEIRGRNQAPEERRAPLTTHPAPHPAIDTSVPHSARIRDYWLGGKDTYPVDEAAGDAYTAVFPGIVTIARGSRAFPRRALAYLVTEAGIRQFLDVGTGLPTAGNTHEAAQRRASGAGCGAGGWNGPARRPRPAVGSGRPRGQRWCG